MTSLQVDDVTLLLALCIALVLSASLYLTRLYTPALHPLILTRQSDVSQIRQQHSSPTFRNANSPAGFELAGRPRRGAADVASMLSLGSAAPGAIDEARLVYGQQSSTNDVLRQAGQLANGLTALLKTAEPTLAVCAEKDSLEAVVALLASSQHKKPFSTYVVPAAAAQQPKALPSDAKLNVIFTTLASLQQALALPHTSDALLILPSLADAEAAASQAKLRAFSFDQVIDAASSSSTALPTLEASQYDTASARPFASYWLAATQEWVVVSQGNLTAGVTAQLSFFPADAIPAPGDSIFVESASDEGVGAATASPAGLALALVALYTGASIASGPLLNGSKTSEELKAARPTLLYTSTSGGAALAAALTKAAGGGPLTHLAQRIKLGLLRHGALQGISLIDALLAPAASALGLSRTRALLLIGQGNASQRTLDVLRVNLSACVMHAFLPTALAGVALTAPIMASHSLDLQAFAEYAIQGRKMPAHVGPACVAVEIRLFESEKAKKEGVAGAATEAGREGDWSGEIQVRGKTLAGAADEEEWRSTGSLATIRSNGTFVIVRDNASSSIAHPSPSNSKSSRTTTSLPLLSLVALSLLAAPANAQVPGEHPLMQLSRRAGGLNDSHINVARQSMLVSQRASWEQGTAQSALLELDAGEWSVFTSKDGGPPWAPSRRVRGGSASGAPIPVLSMAYHSVSAQDARGKLCSRVTGDESASGGSALDPAACLEGVLIGAYAAGQVVDNEVTDGYWGNAARAQLRYVLEEAPRSPEGAISHRASSVALWSDAVYMGPPAIAAYGLMTSNQSLLQAAYDQIRLYRDGLRITEGPAQGMWAHINDITRPNASDTGAWLTGQGWVTAGMARVVASIAQSGFDMSSQTNDIVAWATEIQQASYAFAEPNGLLRNYVNVSEGRNSFLDAAGSALLASATFRFASLTSDTRFVGNAERIYATTEGGLDRIGTFDGSFDTVDALGFTFAGDTSPESLAAQLLLAAARRDHSAGNVTGLTGPGSGFKGGAASNVARPSSAALLVAIVALASATLI